MSWKKYLQGRPAPTISSLLFPHFKDEEQAQLEAYRLEWEKKHGPTDVTKYYATRWPAEESDTLFKLDPKAYFDGTPAFYQDMVRENLTEAARDGQLDDYPSSFVSMFVSGKIKPRSSDPPAR